MRQLDDTFILSEALEGLYGYSDIGQTLKGYKENHIPIINSYNSDYSVSAVGSAEFGLVTAFRRNRVKWATRAEPDTTKQIAPSSFKQTVIMLKKSCVLLYKQAIQDRIKFF